MKTIHRLVWALALIMMLSSCSQPGGQGADGKPDIVATTGLIADVVRQVAGDRLAVTALMKPGQDPHTFEPTPADAAHLQQAELVFANGLGYEEGLIPLLKDLEAGGKVRIVYVSDGVVVLQAAEGARHTAGDPHTWMDPNNVKIWADNIAAALAGVDPADAAVFRANADAYKVQLAELDTFIAAQVATIPEANRKLVTDHEALGYFAQRYGFEVIGAVIPNVSTDAEPSAADMASLVTAMRKAKVKAIFVETAVNDTMARQVAAEVGYPVQVLTLHHDLGVPGSGADTYLSMMHVNIETIVKGLANG